MNANIEARDICQRTPFYWACCQGNLEIVRYLVSLGINVNAHSSLFRVPLHKCCFIGRYDVVEYLLTLPNIDSSKVDDKGRTALHHCC